MVKLFFINQKASSCKKNQSGKHTAAPTITGAIRGTFREMAYIELGLETLDCKRWLGKWCSFYKTKTKKLHLI